MVQEKIYNLSQVLFSLKATKATGTSMSFILALSVIIVWGFTGPLFHFSDTWQLVIKHRYDDRNLPDGLPYSAYAKQGCAGDSSESSTK